MKSLGDSHVLTRIVAAKRKRVADAQMRVPPVIVERMASMAPAPLSFRAALGGGPTTRIIAEVKKASPSAGVLIDPLDAGALAATYRDAGAAAVSVVTEEDYFQGNLGWVCQAAGNSGLPVLRKDFVFDDYQVLETKASGASAILLIVALLEPGELAGLIRAAGDAGLDALVEVHDEQELDEALNAGARMVGVNNRNLKTFDVDLEIAVRLGEKIPRGVVFVAESGIRSRSDIHRLQAAGADAFLVGEYLIRSPDPAAVLRELL
jgi:indole-3-glycerol phosphate synthase